MKRILPALLCLVALILGLVLGRLTQQTPLEAALERYTEVIQGPMPEDVRLTIYVMDLQILYPVPTSRADLVTRPHEKIVVGPEELADHWDQFRQISPSALREVAEPENYRNHGVGYILEIGDGQGNYETILEVYNVGLNASVNRVEIEDEEFLLDLVIPFFTDTALSLRCLNR